MLDTDLDADDWADLVKLYKARGEEEHGAPFPQGPHDQLWGAIGAVFGSWMNQRAITYRRLHGIPESWGTAVNVQAMVFGNMGETSATGVAFTRNPSTGERRLYGEFLINAQGEDVVAGIRTPQEITEIARQESGSDKPSLERAMPAAFAELTRIYGLLETHYRDMQDLEFTVEQGKLWMLQTRSGKRTGKAALRIAGPVPHRAHVLRRGSHPRRARDDPRRRREDPPHRASKAVADAAQRLHRAVRDHGRPAGDDPAARSEITEIARQEVAGARHAGSVRRARRITATCRTSSSR
jgi:pyruvate,orthophosphate dikinase